MKHTIIALATAALLSTTALGASAQTNGDEFTMVVGSVYRLLAELNLPTDNISNLTMAQIGAIISIADSHEMGDAARVRVQKILGE